MSQRAKKKFEFRVIAGELKGRKITAPDLGVTRPPLTRLRKSIFDFLRPYLEDATYLDLFSGTGSYLFEAVSRGAAKAVGVEMETQLADSINQQAFEMQVNNRLRCVCGDVLTVIPQLSVQNERFDLIMMAPPQYRGIIDTTLKSLAEHSLLAPDGLLLCQHDTSETARTDFSSHEIVQQRKYGNTTFTILKDK